MAQEPPSTQQTRPIPRSPDRTRPWSLGEICRLERDLPVLRATMAWLRDYVACPHADLGRPGVVCPFVPRALALDQIYLSVLPSASKNPDDVDSALLGYRDQFLAMESDAEAGPPPESNRPSTVDIPPYRAIITVLPGLELDALRAIQSRLKPHFIDFGLMLGEFHPVHPGTALHNPNFRPLISPYPLLGIRRMIDSDLVFLTRQEDSAPRRVRFLECFIRFLGPSIAPARVEAARIALRSAQAEVAAS